jgi:hypothetical protein
MFEHPTDGNPGTVGDLDSEVKRLIQVFCSAKVFQPTMITEESASYDRIKAIKPYPVFKV